MRHSDTDSSVNDYSNGIPWFSSDDEDSQDEADRSSIITQEPSIDRSAIEPAKMQSVRIVLDTLMASKAGGAQKFRPTSPVSLNRPPESDSEYVPESDEDEDETTDVGRKQKGKPFAIKKPPPNAVKNPARKPLQQRKKTGPPKKRPSEPAGSDDDIIVVKTPSPTKKQRPLERVASQNHDESSVIQSPARKSTPASAAAAGPSHRLDNTSTRESVHRYFRDLEREVDNEGDDEDGDNSPMAFLQKIYLMVTKIDNKLELFQSLISKDNGYFFCQPNSDYIFKLTIKIRSFVRFPLRMPEEVTYIEELLKRKLDYVVFALIVYLTSVTAGGNVFFSAGNLWDKIFTPFLSCKVAWASIGESNQG